MQKNEVTHIRVLATILVVLGHSMIIYDPSWNTFSTPYTSNFFFILKQFINIIQMPLFFIISGYLFFYTMQKHKYNSFKDLFKDKIKRLYIPFLFVCVFWLIPIRFFVNYQPYVKVGFAKTLLLAISGLDSGHLWFLPTLFFIFCIMYFACSEKLKLNDKMKFLIFVIAHFLSFLLPSALFIGYISKYLIYFFIGYYWSKNDIKFTFHLPVLMLTIITTIISLILCICISSSKVSLLIQAVLNLPSSIGIAYMLFVAFKKLKVGKFEQFINKNSFAIYLFHSPVIYICYKFLSNLRPYILVPLNVCISISVALLLAFIIRRLHLNFLIGENKNKA